MTDIDEQSFAGIWTAMVTPFLEDDRIDWASFEKLLMRQAEAGVTGVVVFGATGEAPTLTVQEKLSLVRKAKTLVGDQLFVMAGTGGQSTDQSLELSRLAVDAGADALLVVTPPYVKPNPAGLKKHFQVLAEETQVPICLYHNPARTNQKLTAALMTELCHIPGVNMVKEASGDLAFFSECQISSDAMFLSGDDATFLPSLAIGGEGSICTTSNVFPREFVRMQQLFEAGKTEKAFEIHEALFALIQAMFCETNPCPVKAALSHMKLCESQLRLPLAPVSESNFKKIVGILDETKARLDALV